MSSVVLRAVCKTYGSGRPAVVNAIDLEVAQGEFIVLLGPSGCGKTTTLRMIAGFVEPSSGQILFDGADVTRVPPRLRNIGMVFQNYALFPTMTVAQNIAFGPSQRGLDSRKVMARVAELLELTQLTSRQDHYPDELSGGQQQRVALARALAFSPAVLLMDEPLGALDVQLRETMQIELRRLQRSLGITTILVTHDQQEAMSLADRIVVMADGLIQQIGSPDALYRQPGNRFVAEFIGKNNILGGRIVEQLGRLRVRLTDDVAVNLPPGGLWQAGTPIEIAIRPEHIDIAPAAGTMDGDVEGVVEARRFLGNLVQYDVRMSWGQTILVECATRQAPIDHGERVMLRWNTEDVTALDARAAAVAPGLGG
jgi:spermidine/putrescine ABC transporter ATP-binding subunit